MNLSINNLIQNQPNFQARIKIKPADTAKLFSAAAVCSTAGAFLSNIPIGEDLIDSALDKNINIDSIRDVPVLNSMVEDVETMRLYEMHNIETPHEDTRSLASVSYLTGALFNITGSYFSTIGSGVDPFDNAKSASNSNNKNRSIPS